MSNVQSWQLTTVKQLKGSNLFLRPKLIWRVRWIEKFLHDIRYNLQQNDLDRNLFRICDMMFFLQRHKNRLTFSFNEVIVISKLNGQSSFWQWMMHNFCLPKLMVLQIFQNVLDCLIVRCKKFQGLILHRMTMFSYSLVGVFHMIFWITEYGVSTVV